MMYEHLDTASKYVEMQQPFRTLGFELHLHEDAEQEENAIVFHSTISNQRSIELEISQLHNGSETLLFLIFNISTKEEVGENEKAYLFLDQWLRENKNKNCDDSFSLFPDREELKPQLQQFFDFVIAQLQQPDLKAIIEGKNWESQPFDWGMFGR